MSDEPRDSSRNLDRDLRLFLVYRFLSTSYLFAPCIVLFFGARGLSFTEITLLNSVYAVTAVLFEVPTGVLADRWGRRRAMVLGSLMMAAGCALDWRGHSFVMFAVGEGLLALGMTLTSGADSAWLYDLLLDAGREQEYRRREGTASAAKLAGAAVALAVGGRLASHSLSATYVATGVVCLLASMTALLLRESRLPPTHHHDRTGAVYRQMAESARSVFHHRPLLFAVGFSTLVFTLVRMAIYLYQPFLSAAGFNLSRVGDLMALLSLAAAFGAHYIESVRRRLGEGALVVGLPAVLALSYAVLGRYIAEWGIVMLLFQSLVNGIYSPFSKELLNREILDCTKRATVLSVESMVRRLVFGAFAPLAGFMIDRNGLGAGFYVCAALGVVGTSFLAVHVAGGRAFFTKGVAGEHTPLPEPMPMMLSHPSQPFPDRSPDRSQDRSVDRTQERSAERSDRTVARA